MFLSVVLTQLDYLIPLVVAFVTGIAGPLVLTYFRHRLRVKTVRETETERRRRDFNTSISVQKKVNDSINSLQATYSLDRIWIAQFHNGGHFYPGNKSMKKMSVTFEATAPGISADIMKMQNLPVSFFSPVLEKITSGAECVVVDVYTEEDHALRSFWSSKGINAVYVYPIHCLEGGFIGLLCVDIIKSDELLTEEVNKHLKNEAALLSGYVATLSVEKS